MDDATKAKRRGSYTKQKSVSFGHAKRSYIFNPHTIVKDHDTNVIDNDVEAVLDGNIDAFLLGGLVGKNK